MLIILQIGIWILIQQHKLVAFLQELLQFLHLIRQMMLKHYANKQRSLRLWLCACCVGESCM